MLIPKDRIRSRSNALPKLYREVISGKNEQYFLLEGVRFLEEAVKTKFPLHSVVFLAPLLTKPRTKELLIDLQRQGVELYEVSEDVMKICSDVDAPQGICALAHRPHNAIEDILQKDDLFFLVLAGVSDPGNLGSLIRSADAAGIDGVIVTEGSASAFNPKSVRSTMGSALRIPLLDKVKVEELLFAFGEKKVRLVATDSHGGVDFRDADYSGSVALCLGGEAEGIPESLKKASGLKVQIRLHHDVESLNVAAAGAIVLFEIAGRRKSS